MATNGTDLSLAIGGAAGQGIATPGNILARIFVRRGLHLYAYNAYQSIIRGGHIFLTMRIKDQEVHTHGDGIGYPWFFLLPRTPPGIVTPAPRFFLPAP